MDYESFGRRIRERRIAQRLTMQALANTAGISLSFLGHIERGTRKASLETAAAIANGLRVGLDELMSESLTGGPTPAERMMADNLIRLLREYQKEKTPATT